MWPQAFFLYIAQGEIPGKQTRKTINGNEVLWLEPPFHLPNKCMSVETLIVFFDTYGNTKVPLVLNLEAKAEMFLYIFV